MELALVTAVLVAVAVAVRIAAGVPDRRRAAARASIEADAGRDRRAELRARELLRGCLDEQQWAMYRALGFLRVHGRVCGRDEDAATGEPPLAVSGRVFDGQAEPGGAPSDAGLADGLAHAFLIYARKPVVAYEPATGRLLSEHHIALPDLLPAAGLVRLAASDDVLAKWMGLTSDEARLLDAAETHPVGHRHDPARLRRDLWRLAEWERRRAGRTVGRGR